MKTQIKESEAVIKRQIKQISEEIETLKLQLLKPHFTKSAEQDYDIKSQIIEKQNRMIELLMEQAGENSK